MHALHNFNGVMTIAGALQNSALTRLRLAETSNEWKKKRSPALKLERELLALVESASEITERMLKTPSVPGLPSLGMSLSSLSQIDHLHSDTFQGLINFVKRRLYYEILAPLHQYKICLYDIQRNPLIQDLLLDGIHRKRTERELYSLSLFIEPDNVGREQS